MELKNLGENLGFSYLFAGDFEKNETATLSATNRSPSPRFIAKAKKSAS